VKKPCLQALQDGIYMTYGELDLHRSFTLYSGEDWLIDNGYIKPSLPAEEEIVEKPSFRERIKPYYKKKL